MTESGVRVVSAGQASEPATLAPPREDPIYGALSALGAPGALEERVRTSWVQFGLKSARLLRVCVLQTHYKPWLRGRVLARAVFRSRKSPTGRASQFLFLQLYPTPERAHRRIAVNSAKRALACKGPPVFLIEDWNAVVWSLPNGPKLRRAEACFQRRTFEAFLSRVGPALAWTPASEPPPVPELVRYVPRRRALFRYQPVDGRSPPLYLKFYAGKGHKIPAYNLAQVAEAASAGELRFRPPALLAHSARRRALVLEALPGVQLTGLLTPGEPRLFAALGRALSSLHTSRLEPRSTWTPQIELRALRGAMRDVERALPALADALATVLGQIEQIGSRLAFEAGRPIHGNLFGDQILVEENGSIGVVDWDDLCTGDPLYDLGRLSAHCIYVWRRAGFEPPAASPSLASLLASYARASGQALDSDRLRWHVAVGLLMRAKISGLRSLRPRWIEDVRASVGEAERILSGGSAWLPAP